MDALWFISLALASSSLAVTTGSLVRARVRKPLIRRIAELDDEITRERAVMRRRLDESERERKATIAHMRTALGMTAEGESKVVLSGHQFAQRVVDRVMGLSEVDAATISDEVGLPWVREVNAADAQLAAAAGSVLRAAPAIQFDWRQVHVELADARHLVVRPLLGTFPRLALVTSSTSRPTSAFALDATLAFAAISNGALATTAGPEPADPLVGHDSQPGEAAKGQVAQNLQAELESARATCGARALVVAIGDDALAAAVVNGPDRSRIDCLIRALRPLLSSVERRCRSTGRRVELTSTAGSCVTFAPLGTAGRFGLLAVGADGPIDPAVIDRLVGRLRRFLPTPAAIELAPRGVV